MEILQKGKTISIITRQKLPIKEILFDAGIALILIWGVFIFLVIFSLQPIKEILPYFIAITFLLLVPLVSGILIRRARHNRKILLDGEKGTLLFKGIVRQKRFTFKEIKELKVSKYRFKKGLFLYRFGIVLFSGKVLRLIQDVPDKEALCSLGEKVENLIKKPLSIDS